MDKTGTTILFDKDRLCSSYGRNGRIMSSGYCWRESFGDVTIHPVTSKGNISFSAFLEVQKEAWVGYALMKVLETMKTTGQLPTLVGVHPLVDCMIDQIVRGNHENP